MQKNSEKVKRIFVKVFGFTDVERHALNTVFRLSEARPLVYSLWTPEAPEKARVALLDGDSWEASLELANPANDKLQLAWVGEGAPEKAWRVFPRPLRWADVISGMDSIFDTPAAGSVEPSLDFDVSVTQPLVSAAESGVDLYADETVDTQPDTSAWADIDAATQPAPQQQPAAQAEPVAGSIRALVIDADPAARLYMRARLALAGLMQVDEAETGKQALELLRVHVYRLVVVDMNINEGSTDIGGWKLIDDLKASTPPIPHLIMTGEQLTLLDAVRARFAGLRGALRKTLDPDALEALLTKACAQS